MLSAVYRAVKPSAIVRALVEALVNEARPRIGLHWAAVHLPIEKDWWWGNDWCHARKQRSSRVGATRHLKVARLTHYARQNASGTVLLYAFDKAARRDNPTWSGNRAAYGPPVCRDDFGEATFKLQLPPVVPYTFRNAAELFFAAQAPRGVLRQRLLHIQQGCRADALVNAYGAGNRRWWQLCLRLRKARV